MSKTTIEWSEFTWSPLRVRVREDAAEIARAKGYTSLVQIATKMAGRVGQHCEHVSDGCKNCYSGTWQARCFKHNGTGLPFDRRSRDLVEPFADENVLYQPLHWKKPRRIFVENQSDLFGEWYSFEDILAVHFVMLGAPQHTYQVLTKRIERAREFYLWWDRTYPGHGWPKHLHLGVSVEDQATADARIPVLLGIPYAEVRWVSYEPALGPVDFDLPRCDAHDRDELFFDDDINCECCVACRADGRPGELSYGHWLDPLNGGLNWIVVGGESGPGARPFDIAWARQTIEQCREAGVACFVKQISGKPYDSEAVKQPEGYWPISEERYGSVKAFPGAAQEYALCHVLNDRKGGDMAEWPEPIRVREYPRIAK